MLKAAADAFEAGVADVRPPAAKLHKTAAESDPDKKTYGPAMATKVRWWHKGSGMSDW